MVIHLFHDHIGLSFLFPAVLEEEPDHNAKTTEKDMKARQGTRMLGYSIVDGGLSGCGLWIREYATM